MSKNEWHTADIDTLPLCLTVPDAARLCGLTEGTAYMLVRRAWKPFVIKADRVLLIRTSGLLRWIGEIDN